MKNVKLFEEFINEAKSLTVGDKDWARMLKLVLKDDNGARIARKITNKNKAIARFIAGLQLSKSKIEFDEYLEKYVSPTKFIDIGNLAIELGATHDEIMDLYNKTNIPKKYLNDLSKYASSKLDNWVVGKVSDIIISLGYTIEYDGKGGNAITSSGKDAMSRSGRVWTIGYRSLIKKDGESYKFNFDAITSESSDDNKVKYVIHGSSDMIFSDLQDEVLGIVKLRKILKKKLN